MSSTPLSTGRRSRANSKLLANSAEDYALDQIAKEAETRLAARRQARAEAREIRMKELEKQQKDLDETSDRHFEIFGNNDPLRNSGITGITSAIKTPVTVRESRGSSYTSSRRSSEDSLDVPLSDARDFRHQLNELDDKFRKAMINNAQLDNEKQSYSYQVELLRDEIEELEENYIRVQKDFKEKSRTYDQLNRDFKKLQQECDYIRECLKQREDLIEEAGLVLIDSDEPNPTLESESSHLTNGDISDKRSESIGDESGSESGISGSATKSLFPSNASLISQEAAQLLTGIDGLSLEAKLKNLFTEKKLLMNEINKIKTELEDERQRTNKLEELTIMQGSNQSLNCDTKLDVQREANKLVSDYKFKLKKSEQEVSVLSGTVARLETQLTRYRTSAEEAEKLEDELKADKRKSQRELREALARIEELETSNAHLQKRIDKLKSNRNIVITK